MGTENMPDRDLAALHQAVIQNPAEDTPRLMYADRLDEIGGDSNAALARFIRTGIEYHNMGEPPVEVIPAMLMPRGPGYFKMPGDAKKDEHSVPFDRATHQKMQVELEQMWRLGWQNWVIGKLPVGATYVEWAMRFHVCHVRPGTVRVARHHINGDRTDNRRENIRELDVPMAPASYQLHCVRGFLSRFVGTWQQWCADGDQLVKRNPISRVEFTNMPGPSWPCLDQWPTVPRGGWILPVSPDDDSD